MVKKTLLRLALEKAGLDIDPKELIKDEAAIAFGYQDEVSAVSYTHLTLPTKA